jgi:hypothetical protein
MFLTFLGVLSARFLGNMGKITQHLIFNFIHLASFSDGHPISSFSPARNWIVS